MNDIVSSVQALVLKQQEWELLAEHLQPLIMGVFKQMLPKPPVTNCTGECSFSHLKRIKSALR